tara:strand:+ start:4726 stop:5052 length:327 start_codon:yes stop_codon:yes gene_type:complete
MGNVELRINYISEENEEDAPITEENWIFKTDVDELKVDVHHFAYGWKREDFDMYVPAGSFKKFVAHAQENGLNYSVTNAASWLIDNIESRAIEHVEKIHEYCKNHDKP